MNINAQIIKKGANKEFAVIPFEEFVQMKDMISDYEDLLELRSAKSIDSSKEGKSAKTLLLELTN